MTSTAAPTLALAHDRRAVWESVVDEVDASVCLEADGINDTAAANRYGVRDVHELAEQLTSLIAVQVGPEPRDESAEPIHYLRLAARGLLFAIPGLFYLVVARADTTRAVTLTLVTSMLAAWGLSQGVAVVAYRVLGRGNPRCAAVALRRILTFAAVSAGLCILVAATLGATLFVALAAGQVLYVLAATVLLFYNADRVLGACLIPGAAVSLLFLMHWNVPLPVAVTAVPLTILLVLGCAWLLAYRAFPDTKPTATPVLADVVASAPFVVNGFLSGLTVAYMPLRMVTGSRSGAMHPTDLTIVPLVLCMGCAEIELLKLRADARRLMQCCRRLKDYRRGATRLVATAQSRFLLVLLATSSLVALVIARATGINSRDLTLLLSYSILGTALLGALMLVAVDRVATAIFAFGTTACALAVGVALVRISGIELSVEAGYLASCVVLFVCMSVLTVRTLRDPHMLA